MFAQRGPCLPGSITCSEPADRPAILCTHQTSAFPPAVADVALSEAKDIVSVVYGAPGSGRRKQSLLLHWGLGRYCERNRAAA